MVGLPDERESEVVLAFAFNNIYIAIILRDHGLIAVSSGWMDCLPLLSLEIVYYLYYDPKIAMVVVVIFILFVLRRRRRRRGSVAWVAMVFCRLFVVFFDFGF